MTLRRAAVLMGLATAAPAAAADLALPALSYPASQAPTAVEVGTNWYVRGDIGAAFATSSPSIALPYLAAAPFTVFTAAGAANGQDAGFAGGLGFGYRVNDYLRFDATWTYWQAPERTRSIAAICPYSFTPWPAAPATPAGYLWDPSDACAGSTSLRRHNDSFLVNAYADLGTYRGFTPYVGAGVGANMNTAQVSSTFLETNNGYVPYSVTYGGGAPNVWVNSAGEALNPQPQVVFASQTWNRTINRTNWRFAWAVMAGFGFELTPSITLDIGYRYLNGGSTTVIANPFTGLSMKQNVYAQMVTVGLRFVPQ